LESVECVYIGPFKELEPIPQFRGNREIGALSGNALLAIVLTLRRHRAGPHSFQFRADSLPHDRPRRCLSHCFPESRLELSPSVAFFRRINRITRIASVATRKMKPGRGARKPNPIRWEWTDKNPITQVRQSAKRSKIPTVLSVEEIQRLFSWIKEPCRTAVILIFPLQSQQFSHPQTAHRIVRFDVGLRKSNRPVGCMELPASISIIQPGLGACDRPQDRSHRL